tara:strand:+ start:97 stop:657 length:561 start_codon:yes stop_codon:yes gene_type:complete
LRYKYIDHTLKQLGFIETRWNQNYDGKIRYFSKEHEDLSYTAFIIFKDNVLNGSGVKTFYKICNDFKLNEKQNKISNYSFLNRNNVITCSTHPHNTYFQILSEIGIFGFFMIIFLFCKILFLNCKILLNKKYNNINLSYYFLNIGIIINLFPLIPSGSFFNNWMCLIMFYPMGFWIYLSKKYEKQN